MYVFGYKMLRFSCALYDKYVKVILWKWYFIIYFFVNIQYVIRLLMRKKGILFLEANQLLGLGQTLIAKLILFSFLREHKEGNPYYHILKWFALLWRNLKRIGYSWIHLFKKCVLNIMQWIVWRMNVWCPKFKGNWINSVLQLFYKECHLLFELRTALNNSGKWLLMYNRSKFVSNKAFRIKSLNDWIHRF